MKLKAYPPEWADNDALRTAAARWQRRRLLTNEQQAAIDAAHPVAYVRPLLFLRVGLFIATWLGMGSVAASLATMTQFDGGTLFYCLVTLVGGIFVLEQVIRSMRHYHSGVDNALLYGALCAWAGVVFSLLEPLVSLRHWDSSPLGGPVFWLGLGLLLAAQIPAILRYADPVVAVVAFGTAFTLLGSLVLTTTLGFLLLPFAVMAAAAGLHVWLRRLAARPDYFYYRSCILTLRTLALAFIYLAGNYLVLREGQAALLDKYHPGPSAQIPLAWLFYLTTAGIPLVYIGLGLRRHDRLLLSLGVLAVAFSLFTLRYYHAVLPPELAATFGGLLLITLTLAALRYLRTARHGFTAAADDAHNPHFNLESVITAQTAHIPAAPEAGFQFGGGHPGGGGAEGAY